MNSRFNSLRSRIAGSSSRLAAGFALVLVSASGSAMAQSFVDSNPSLYRCAVLGETRSCRQDAPRPEAWMEEWVELGTEAKALRHLGAEPADAIARARLHGEEPLRHVVQVTRVPLTAGQAYARATGQLVISDERREVIRVEPARETAPSLYDDWSASAPVRSGVSPVAGK